MRRIRKQQRVVISSLPVSRDLQPSSLCLYHTCHSRFPGERAQPSSRSLLRHVCYHNSGAIFLARSHEGIYIDAGDQGVGVYYGALSTKIR